MPSAARITDMHTCPLATPNPHVGGVTGPCVPTVLIGSLPAAVVGDLCVCAGPPDTIVKGSTTVFIGGKAGSTAGRFNGAWRSNSWRFANRSNWGIK